MIDTHVHLNNNCLNNHLKTYINEAKKANINFFICVGWDLKSSLKAIKIAKKNKNIFASIGIHPNDINKIKKNDFNKIEKFLLNKIENKIIAIGEIGLDLLNNANYQEQKKYFIKFINLANKYCLPIIVHSRNADKYTYEILKKNKVIYGGVMHCYSSGKNYINKYIKLNFFFGVNGIITFKKNDEFRKTISFIPLKRLLLETDAPFLTPVPFRGKINHSKYIPYIVKEIANIKKTDVKKIENITTKNFINLFKVNIT